MLSDSLHRVKHSLARTDMVCLSVTLHVSEASDKIHDGNHENMNDVL